jgi:hypothetical protein
MPCKERLETSRCRRWLYRPCTASFGVGSLKNWRSDDFQNEAQGLFRATAKPKARYAVVPQRFKNWTLPRLLPVRMLDAQLAKLLGLTKATKGGLRS